MQTMNANKHTKNTNKKKQMHTDSKTNASKQTNKQMQTNKECKQIKNNCNQTNKKKQMQTNKSKCVK